ncbi:MAG: hypothetical protein ABL929_09060, partial [Ferruginibacter sp.]
KKEFHTKIWIILFLLFSNSGITLNAQTISYPTAAQSISIGLDSTLLTVKIDFPNSGACGTNPLVTINLGVLNSPGEIQYISNSLTKLAGNADVNIIESNISNLQNPIFQINTLSTLANKSITFSIKRRANCNTASTTKDNITVSGGCNFSETNIATNVYTLLSPTLSIIAPSALANANIGNTINRNITVINGGNGCLDTLGFWVRYAGSTISLNSIKIGATTLTPIFQNSDSAYFRITGNFFGVDNLFCNGEQLIFTENFTILKCINTPTSYGVEWFSHTTNIACSKINVTSDITMSNDLPLITTTLPNPNKDFCPDGGYTIQKLRVTNSGTGPAINYKLTYWGWTEGAFYFTYTDTTNWVVKSSTGVVLGNMVRVPGAALVNYADYLKYNSACVLDPTWFNNNVEMTLPGLVIPAGDYVEIEFREYHTNVSCTQIQCYPDYYGWAAVAVATSYKNQCENSLNNSPRTNLWTTSYPRAQYNVQGPTDINAGPFNLQLNYSSLLSQVKAINGRSYIFIKLPSNITLNGAITHTLQMYYGTAYAANITNFMSNDTLFIKMNENSFAYGIITIPLLATCGSGGPKNFKIGHLHWYDSTNCASKVLSLACQTYNINLHCPVSCPKGGATPISFDLKRVNYGYPDANNDNFPDALVGTPNLSLINLKNTLNGDTVLGTWNIKVFPNTVDAPYINVPFNHLYIDFPLTAQNAANISAGYTNWPYRYNPLPNGRATIYTNGVFVSNCTISPTIISGIAHYDFSSCKASWFTGDSLVVNAKFITGAVCNSGGYYHAFTNAEVYTTYSPQATPTTAPINNSTYTCDHFQSFVDILNSYSSSWNYDQVISGCTSRTLYVGHENSLVDNGAPTKFPYEARIISVPDTVVIKMPFGFDYEIGSAVWNSWAYGSGINGGYSLAIPSANIINSGSLLKLVNLKSLFTIYGGTNTLPGEYLGMNFSYKVIPTCNAISGGIVQTAHIITNAGNGFNTPTSYYQHNPWQGQNALYDSAKANVTYNAPQPILSGGAGVIHSSNGTASWSVVLQNGSSTVAATNNWFYISPVNSLSNIVIKEGTTTILPDANGFYQLGNLAASANRLFTVTAKTGNCGIDSMQINQGFNCIAYPSSFVMQNCTKSNWLAIDNNQSQIQLSVSTQPLSLLTDCNAQTVEYVLNSSHSAFADNPIFLVTPPLGLTITQGQIEYPTGSGFWQTITPSITSGVYTYKVEDHAQVIANWGTNGLPGSIDYPASDKRQAKLKLIFNLDCSFANGSKIMVEQRADRPCGTPLTTTYGYGDKVRTNPIYIDQSLPCFIDATNYAITPQTGNINWNSLAWSLGHVPTCCESAHITYTGTNAGVDAVTVDITNDICIKNLTLVNSATSGTNKIFKTILHPNYNMVMNGFVRMSASGNLSSDSCIFIAKGGGTITVFRNTRIGLNTDNAYCIFGSAPGTSTYANYVLHGDSLTFNAKSYTNPKFTSIILNPLFTDTVYISNNTNTSPFANALTFDVLKIGANGSPTTAITVGTNQNSYVNDNGGYVEVTPASTLIMPANFSINAKDFIAPGIFNSSFILQPNSTLQLGGIAGGITGSNFPANFSTYNLTPTSTVLFYGAAQSIPGTVNNVNAYGNITLTGTGVKTGSASNVNLAGNLYRTNTGHTFNANTGRFTFTSAINGQRYYADAGATPINFYDFTNNNTHTAGLSLDSTIGILNEFEPKPNTKTILNTGNVIMRSSALRTSHITNLGATIPSIVYNGNYRFEIERYLFGEKAWRFLATPVQLNAADVTTPTIAASWREGVSALTSTNYGTAITGPSGPNAELDYYTQRGSMKWYNDAANVWTELSNTTSTKIANTQGYMVFVRGDRGAVNSSNTSILGTPTNLRIKGKIRTANQSFNVLANKFQSIGNPYASQINFATITKSFTANAFIVWNPVLPGLYGVGGYENYSLVGSDYRLNGLAGGAIRNTIQSGEAFFVQNNSASAGTITIKEADKGILSSLVSRTSNANIVIPTIDFSLFEKNASNNYIFVDGATTSFDNTFSNSIDNDDVIKFTNTYDNLFIKSNNKNLVVERRQMPTQADTIKLGLTGTRVAGYSFIIDPYVFTSVALKPYLVDKFLNTETEINIQDTTKVFFDITTDAASKATDRFIIIFKQNPTNFTNIAAIRNSDNTVTINWGVQTEANINNYSIEQSNDGSNFAQIKTQ